MKYTIDLRVHTDDRHGIKGVCPKNALNQFEPFWSADGIFHDVFEHVHEEEHPYFSGRGAFTLWGEMAASGMAIAYRDIGINNFKFRKYGMDRDFTADTVYILQEALYESKQEPDIEPYLEYSIDKDRCKVPYQRPLDYHSNYNLYSWIGEYQYWVEENKKNENAAIRRFMKTVSFPHIQRCYLWGYKRAQRIIGEDVKHSYLVLDQFLDTWHRICKGNEVSDLFINDEFAYPLQTLRFTVNSKPKLSVKTVLVDKVGNEYSFDKLLY